MSKRTLILTAILLCTLLPFAAHATVTRVIGMGGADANYILKDASNPSIWPQLIQDWPNYAGGEFYTSGSGWDFQKAYVNYQLNAEKKCALQISLDKDQTSEFVGPDTLDYIGGGYNRLNLIWGRPLGDMKIGVGLNYASKSLKHEETSFYLKRDASYSVFGANLGLTALENKLDLGLGFAFASFSDKVGGNEVMKNDGSMKIKFDGRYWYKASDTYALIPNVKFLTKKDGAKYGSNGGSESLTQMKWAVGLGNNWTPMDNMLSIFELGVSGENYEHEVKPATGASSKTKDDLFNVYWRLGFETKIFEWLNGRLGAERLWVSEKDEMMPGKPETGMSSTNTYLGATCHWNRLFLDLLVAPEFLHNGPNFVSGKTTDIFSRVSLKYDFNK